MNRVVAIVATFLLTTTATVATATGQDVPSSRRFHFTYAFTLTPPPGAREASVWLPLPRSAPAQKIHDLAIEANVGYKVSTEHVYGNRIVYLSRMSSPTAPIRASLRFGVTRTEYAGQHGMRPSSRYLAPNKLVPTTGLIKRRAEKVTADKTTVLDKARAIYEYVVDTVRYDKSGTGWGRGDAMFACTEKKGNCTDFHALFVAMARAVGIPARFEIGFPLPPDSKSGTIPGYHCWAEFWLDGRGWIPVDASEARKHSDLRDYYFGKLDPSRVQFTTGRDIVLSPRQAGEPLNYFIYPYVEIDGQPLKDKSLLEVRISYEDF